MMEKQNKVVTMKAAAGDAGFFDGIVDSAVDSVLGGIARRNKVERVSRKLGSGPNLKSEK